MLYLNDTVCRLKPGVETGVGFEFGKVMIPHRDLQLPRFDPQKEIPIIWSNDEIQVVDNRTVKYNGNLGVVSRKFKIGDKIRVSHSGRTGHVLGVKEFATLQSTENPRIIFEDIPVECLSTITKFYGYPGTHILFENWIGMVLSAKRKIIYNHNDEIFFNTTDMSENFVQVPPWMDPYWIADDSMVYPGKQIIFTTKMWKEGKFFSVWGQATSLPIIDKVVVVESIEIEAVSVQWLCPADTTRQDECGMDENPELIPKKIIAGDELKKIKNLSLPAHFLVTNGSGRLYQLSEEYHPVDIKEWKHSFTKETFPMQMSIHSEFETWENGGGSGDAPPRKKMKRENENQTIEDILSDENLENENRMENSIVVKVLFTQQVANILFSDDVSTSEVNSAHCTTIIDSKREESDFLFPFGSWVTRKRCEFYDEDDELYGMIIHIISESKCIVQWTQTMDDDSSATLQEECWNFELKIHEKYNSFCRGGIVLWNTWDCGVILEKFSPDFLGAIIRSFSGEIVVLEPHKLELIEYHGYWDVLRQKWLVRNFDCYLSELRMNPFEQSNEIFTSRVQVYNDVPPSHIYIGTEIPYNRGDQSESSFSKNVYKEILFLQEHLPDGIWVQFFMNRLDLACAVIRGAKGTPYESGLFFFDIKMPIIYPGAPPQVRFLTFGETRELNPNFNNKDGMICSSLLETVSDGCYTERWTKCSNIMQILLSIQGIYLCEHPLFNKPPYAYYKSFEQPSKLQSQKDLQNSKDYNEDICANLVLYYSKVFQCPPSNWRKLITAHFFDNLESLMAKMKDTGVIPKAYSLDKGQSKIDLRCYPEGIQLATMRLELLLQDIKENKWQLFPRI